jgi:hypothetical protein
MKDLIKAMEIFLKYCPEDTYDPTHCEHDVMYVTCVRFSDVSAEDIAALNDLGFKEDKENGGFKSYRFGSS